MKKLYHITLNFNSQIFSIYKHAHSRDQVLKLCCEELSPKFNFSAKYLRMYFNDQKDNFKIEEIKKGVKN